MARKTPGAHDRVALTVSTAPAFPGERRYRAGLGPFTREPQVVEVEPEKAEVLKADPWLVVAEGSA
ncbi:MAG: hypothetical protein KatS3mg124_1846 [Porticoccaceae bacterium]|nr:MAG: hypothetical protein KatS3mg124_1846 [Porticoccaceae bacterium]